MTKRDLQKLASESPRWASKSWKDNNDISLGVEVTLCRNLVGHRMTSTSSADDNKEVSRLISESIKFPHNINLNGIGRIERSMLQERMLLLAGIMKHPPFSSLMFSNDELNLVAVNELDHVRIATYSPDMDIEDALVRVLKIESEMKITLDLDNLPMTISNAFYDATISAVLSIPAIHITGASILAAISLASAGFFLEPLFGHPSNSANMIRISSKTRMKDIKSEIKKMQNLVDTLVKIETRRRKSILGDLVAKDIITRGWGVMSNAYKLSEEEAIKPMSWSIAGINAGIDTSLDVNAIKDIMVGSMCGHLFIHGGNTSCEEEIRAQYIRKALFGREEVMIG